MHQGKKRQGRKGKGVWVILSPGVCIQSIKNSGLFVRLQHVRIPAFVPDFLFVSATINEYAKHTFNHYFRNSQDWTVFKLCVFCGLVVVSVYI